MSCNVIPEQRPLVKLSEKKGWPLLYYCWMTFFFNVDSKKYNSSMLFKLYPAENSFVSVGKYTENGWGLSIYSYFFYFFKPPKTYKINFKKTR